MPAYGRVYRYVCVHSVTSNDAPGREMEEFPGSPGTPAYPAYVLTYSGSIWKRIHRCHPCHQKTDTPNIVMQLSGISCAGSWKQPKGIAHVHDLLTIILVAASLRYRFTHLSCSSTVVVGMGPLQTLASLGSQASMQTAFGVGFLG